MKFTYIIPPNSNDYRNPLPGITTLLGIMEANNIEVDFIDINREIASRILSEEGILKLLEYYDNLKPNKENSEFLNDLTKRSIKHFENNKNTIMHLKRKLGFYKNILTNSKLFYDPILYELANRGFFEVFFSFYVPYTILCQQLLHDYYSKHHKKIEKTYTIDLEEIKQHFDSYLNPTKEFIKETVERVKNSDTKGVGISINIPEQLFSGLHLAYLLKKETDVHINVGGSFFNWYYQELTNLKEIIGTYFDTISIGDNTCTCTDIIKYLDGEIELSEVANIIYVENDKIKINYSDRKIPFKDLPFPAFGNYTNKDYLAPELVLPLMTSTSCYWRKCIFCECSASPIKYEVKPVEKIVEEIEYLSKKYKTKYFCFWDNAIHPKYANELANLLIKKKLNIKYSIYARLEKEFDKKTLRNMKKSGCLIICWGLDSSSEKILKFINKGITPKVAEEVMKNSHKAGINNFVYLILGHPTQTIEDLEKDVSFIERLKDNLFNLTVVRGLVFVSTSIINKEINKYKKLITLSNNDINEFADKIDDFMGKERTIYRGSCYNILYSAKFGQKFPKTSKKDYKNRLKYINKLYAEFQKKNKETK